MPEVRAAVVLILCLLCHGEAARPPASPSCDVVVAGGSLASFAAAITAAEVSSTVSVCYLEITDWPGGQATAGGTSAIDFAANDENFPKNLPASFAEMLTWGPFGPADFNPGGCTVSTKCFPPAWAVEWMLKKLAEFPNLQTFLNTVVIDAGRDPATGRIVNLTAVQRTPVSGTTGWERLLSDALPDWYWPHSSEYFDKQVLTFTDFKVVIEGSEFGDVLVNSGVRVAQGIESPNENSTQYDQVCGQEVNVCFWMSWSDTPAPVPDPTPPGGDSYGIPDFATAPLVSLQHALTWRRSLTTDRAETETPQKGDLFLINEEQDLPNGNLFLSLADAYAQADNGWQGGVNLTSLALAEQRAYAMYWALKNGTQALIPEAYPYITLNKTAAGTGTGLSKMPYLRESRRSQFGIEGFRMCHQFASVNDSGPGCYLPPNSTLESRGGHIGFHWVDVIGIGSYPFDIHRFPDTWCTYPDYIADHDTVPYYLPFRALTSWDSPNLLVVGKNVAQSFYANAATRLHPEEWVTGVAGGAAAALMVGHGWDTHDVYVNRDILAKLLSSPPISSPLDWTLG